jgi:hypothetical protein
MLIRQIRFFGNSGKDPVCMPCPQEAGKPEGSFRVPTYCIGGSNGALHGRVGLFYLAGIMMIALWRILNIFFMIESNGEIISKIKCFSPPLLSFTS